MLTNPKPAAKLTVYPDQNTLATPEVYKLWEGDNIIGSSTKLCSIKLRLPQISRQHAKFIIRRGNCQFQDLSSGTGNQIIHPNGDKEQLRAFELYTLTFPTTIILADKYRCVFEEWESFQQQKSRQTELNMKKAGISKNNFDAIPIASAIKREEIVEDEVQIIQKQEHFEMEPFVMMQQGDNETISSPEFTQKKKKLNKLASLKDDKEFSLFDDQEDEETIEPKVQKKKVRRNRGNNRPIQGNSAIDNTSRRITRNAYKRTKNDLDNGEEDEEEKASTVSKKKKLNVGTAQPTQAGPATNTRSTRSKVIEEVSVPQQKQDAVKSSKSKEDLKIMFQGFDLNDKQVNKEQRQLKSLGVKIVEESSTTFDVLIMKSLVTTIPFLITLNRGQDIINYDWVKDSLKAKSLQPTENYLIEDPTFEKKYNFKLATSMIRATRRKVGILDSYKVYCSSDILPSFDQIASLIEGCGGTLLKQKPTKKAVTKDIFAIIDEDNESDIEFFKKINIMTYSTELIFSAILQGVLEFEKNRIK